MESNHQIQLAKEGASTIEGASTRNVEVKASTTASVSQQNSVSEKETQADINLQCTSACSTVKILTY